MIKKYWIVSGCERNDEHPAVMITEAKTEEKAVDNFNTEYPGRYYVFAIPIEVDQLIQLRRKTLAIEMSSSSLINRR